MNANTSSNHKWSVDRTIRFLQLYEQYPCLWDTKHESYRNRELRKRAYEQIAQEMSIDDFGVLDVRAKIRSLRNSYTLELAKLLKRKKASYVNEHQKSKLPWFSVADKFFSKIIHIGEQDRIGQDQQETYEAGKVGSKRSENKSQINLPSLNEVFSNPSANLLPPSREDSCDGAYGAFLKMTSRNDDFDVFGSFVANELRSVKNPTVLRSIKRKIQKALLDVYEYPVIGKGMRVLSPSNSVHISDDEHEINTVRCSMVASEGSNEYMKDI